MKPTPLVVQDILLNSKEGTVGRSKLIKWIHQNRNEFKKFAALSQNLITVSPAGKCTKKYTYSALLKGLHRSKKIGFNTLHLVSLLALP